MHPRRLPKLSLRRKWGLVTLKDGQALVTAQPSVTSWHIERLVELFATGVVREAAWLQQCPTVPSKYPLSLAKLELLVQRVAGWDILARSSSGYPLNQAPYTALGPIIGHFLPVTMDPKWVAFHGSEILKARKNSFGLSLGEHDSFAAAFTTRSTMGNRVGLHTALAQYPGAFVYFSTATQYSIKKTVMDSDKLTGWWTQRKTPRSAEIMADDLGCTIPEALTKQVIRDRALCDENMESHRIILLANFGTTFVGGRDDILALRQSLHAIGLEISYIHVDGALDFGFSPNVVSLGSPDTMMKSGLPVVQGITLSHHKAFGIMVSGEVISHTPTSKRLAGLGSAAVDARIVFETWLFQRMYSPKDLIQTGRYCVNNANRLRAKLASIGMATRFNKDSFITLLERITPWMVQDFHLAPEGDWVHHVAMPHVTPGAVDHFVETISKVDEHFATVFNFINPDLNSACGQTLSLVRIRCQDEITFPKVVKFAEQVHKQSDELDAFCLDTFKPRYVYSAISFAAFDPHGDPRIIFLAEVSARMGFFLSRGPVLIAPNASANRDEVQHLASKAFGLLSQLFALDCWRSGDLIETDVFKRPRGSISSIRGSVSSIKNVGLYE